MEKDAGLSLSFGLDVRRSKVGITLERAPTFVKREHRYFVDLVAKLEQFARGLVSKVVEAKVINAKHMTCTRERSADTVAVIRENFGRGFWLSIDNFESGPEQFKLAVITLFLCRVLNVPQPAGQRVPI